MLSKEKSLLIIQKHDEKMKKKSSFDLIKQQKTHDMNMFDTLSYFYE